MTRIRLILNATEKNNQQEISRVQEMSQKNMEQNFFIRSFIFKEEINFERRLVKKCPVAWEIFKLDFLKN